MSPPSSAESVDSVPKSEPDHISTKPAEPVDAVPISETGKNVVESAGSVDSGSKSGARSINIVLRPLYFIVLLILMLVPIMLLGKIYLEVNPFFDRYQNLSSDLKILESNLAKINETIEVLKTELSGVKSSLNSNASKIEDSNKSIQDALSRINESAKMIDDLKRNSENLLVEQKKAVVEINIAASNLKKEQESINMIISQNNALQSGVAILMQRLKDVEVQIQVLKGLIDISHRTKS